jgi:hypothetical protein
MADGADAGERAACVHRGEARSIVEAVHLQHAAVHRRGAGIGVDAGQDQPAGADFLEIAWQAAATILDRSADFGGEVVAADDQRVAAADIVGPRAFDRAGGDAAIAIGADAAAEVDDAAGIGDEARIAAGGIVVKVGFAAVVGDDGGIAGG